MPSRTSAKRKQRFGVNMRKLLFIAISLLSFNVMAGSVDVKLLTSSYMTDDDMYQRSESGERSESGGIQLSYTPKESGYFFASMDSVKVCPKGCAYKYTMIGAGIGDKIKLTKSISLFSQIGYYKITNDFKDRTSEGGEGLGYYLNDRFRDATATPLNRFEAYSIHNNNAFGGSIGLEMNHSLGKGFSVISVLSYRLLKIKEEIHGYQSLAVFDKNGANWEVGLKRDYSSINFGVGLLYSY